ncbi:MotA/TolQ/ExbB proton channel family protein [bacterium]|nr:MotA/TolQ/ExbB proton channel family protein [bacterium]
MDSISIWQIVKQTSTFGVFILLVLVTMSLVSWAIIGHKWRLFRAVQHANAAFRAQFTRSRRLADSLGQAKSYALSPMAVMYAAGYEEMTRLRELKNEGGALQDKLDHLDNDDFEIVEMTMQKTATEELSKLERRNVFLATTGSSTPFMGLLGTVVGIMDAFWSIGERGSASLAVVAPGIAEALLATIVGLGAAIPAVIAYNWANNWMRQMTEQTDGFVLDFLARAKKESR